MDIRYKIAFLILAFVFISFPFSPIVNFGGAIFALLVLSPVLPKFIRVLLAIQALWSLIFIFGSRLYLDELEHDLQHYYFIYQTLQEGNLSALFYFAGGLEVGWPLLFYMIGLLFPDLAAIDVAIANSFVCSLLFLLWLECYGLKDFRSTDRAAVVGVSILFLSMTTFGYLERQAIATALLLFMISVQRLSHKIIFLVLASLFHITSLPLGIVLYILIIHTNRLKSIHILLLFVMLLVVRFLFFDLIWFLSGFATFDGLNKFGLYTREGGDYFFIASVRLFVLLLLLMIPLWLYKKTIRKEWHNVIFFFLCIYFAFIGVPLVSERVGFIFLYIYGFLLCLITFRQGALKGVVGVFAIFYLFLFILEKLNLIAITIDPFWSRYPVISPNPFYFLSV